MKTNYKLVSEMIESIKKNGYLRFDTGSPNRPMCILGHAQSVCDIPEEDWGGADNQILSEFGPYCNDAEANPKKKLVNLVVALRKQLKKTNSDRRHPVASSLNGLNDQTDEETVLEFLQDAKRAFR